MDEKKHISLKHQHGEILGVRPMDMPGVEKAAFH